MKILVKGNIKMNIGKDFYKDNLKNKTFSQILEQYSQEIYGNDAAHKTVFLTFIAKSTDEIVKALNSHEMSMNKNSEANDRLSQKVYYLNIILTIATMLATIFGIFSFFK